MTLYVLFRKWQRLASTSRIDRRVRDQCTKIDSSDTIFVAIYAYRDGRVAETLVDLFHKATCPRRVFVGIYQQNGRADVHCMERYQSTSKYYGYPLYTDNIRVLTGNAHEAKGRSWPLAMIFKALYQGEKYSLILDAGARMSQDWDEKCVVLYNKTIEVNGGDPRTIMTMTPPVRSALSIVNGVGGFPTFARFSQWKEGHLPLPVFESDVVCKYAPLRSTVTFYADISFLFATSALFHEVAFDPRLYYVDKQDLNTLLTIRYWSHGWTAFVPAELLCVRMPVAAQSKCESDVDRPPPLKQHLRESSYHAIYAMLGIEQWPGGTGIERVFGSARSVQTYYDAAGMHFPKKTVTDAALLGLWHAEWMKNMADEEIVAKYGSWSDAMHTREKMRDHWLGTEEHPYDPFSSHP